MLYRKTIETIWGSLTLSCDDSGLIAVVTGGAHDDEHSILAKGVQWLHSYEKGEKPAINVPLACVGTPWQRLVWDALRNVPYGQTVSYGELAKRVGKPKAARAVGNAVGKNPWLILVPCHRVVRADGSLGGFSAGLPMKKALQTHEGIVGLW